MYLLLISLFKFSFVSSVPKINPFHLSTFSYKSQFVFSLYFTLSTIYLPTFFSQLYFSISFIFLCLVSLCIYCLFFLAIYLNWFDLNANAKNAYLELIRHTIKFSYSQFTLHYILNIQGVLL